MSSLRSKSKLNGLYALKGSWFKAMVIFCILALLSFGLSELDDAYRNVFNVVLVLPDGSVNTGLRSLIIEAVFSVISFVVMFPLVLGMLEWYWSLTDGSGNKKGVGDIFGWYGSGRLYLKSLLLGLDIGVRSLLWGLLTCGLPLVLLGAAHYYSAGIDLNANLSGAEVQNVLIAGILVIFGFLLLIGGALLFLYLASRYVLACFLMVEDNSRGVNEVVRDSIKYTRSYRWEITKFQLSYLGWAILCIAVIPLLYVVPYYTSSLSMLAKHMIYSQRPKQDDTVRFDAKTPG